MNLYAILAMVLAILSLIAVVYFAIELMKTIREKADETSRADRAVALAQSNSDTLAIAARQLQSTEEALKASDKALDAARVKLAKYEPGDVAMREIL